jgi:hypothetical protein
MALEFNAERNTVKLQFVGKIPQDVKKYEIYSNHVLKVGTSITSVDGLSSAQIEEVVVCVCVCVCVCIIYIYIYIYTGGRGVAP